MDSVNKKNLNWLVPDELADRFASDIQSRWHGKQKWIGACAAIMRYLQLSEEERITLEKMARDFDGPGGEEDLAQWLEELDAPKTRPRIAASKAGGMHLYPNSQTTKKPKK